MTSRSRAIPVLLTSLSLSLGWGIRGNFGHEIGALIPGALAAIAIVLTLGRADWHRRIIYFAFFGALGWSFGGSMSYGQVLGYTHSGHSLSVLYGFFSLFVIGFLWAAMGGAGTALSAVWDRRQLDGIFPPLVAVFLAWVAQDLFEAWFISINPAYRQASPLYWNDTDWLGVTTAIAAVLALAIARRRLDQASSLILHLGIGWWVGFALLVLVLGLRMTPPRSDNWAGCLGMVAGMIVYFERRGWRALTQAAIVCGFIGGAGFALANLFKLAGVATGWQTNWHSVMEQVYGAINGLGVAAVMLGLGSSAKPSGDETDSARERRWTERFALCFVLVGITYLNFRRNPSTWVRAEAMVETIIGIGAEVWFALAYLAIAAMMLLLIMRHARRPLPFIPVDWLGRGQLLYLVLLWWVVVGNFERSVVAFAPQRLITEGVIFLNAVLCTLLLLYPRGDEMMAADRNDEVPATAMARQRLGRAAAIGVAGMILCVGVSWAVVRAIYGDQVAGNVKRQIRFGAEATATRERPAASEPHP